MEFLVQNEWDEFGDNCTSCIEGCGVGCESLLEPILFFLERPVLIIILFIVILVLAIIKAIPKIKKDWAEQKDQDKDSKS